MKEISEIGFEITLWQDERQSIPEELLDVDVVVCNNLFLYNDISKFNNLKLIQLTSAGIDRVPFSEINEKGILLANAGGIYSIPMAEWTVLKILEFYKDTRFFEENQRNSKWLKQRDLFELNKKNVSIIGTGSVGSETAKRLKAFGCNIIGFNTSGIQKEFFDKCIKIDRVDEFLPQSDIVILTLPLTNKSRNLINSNTLNLFKENAILINVSRGGIINEDDLLDHLSKDKLRGVALDVFIEEPLPIHSPLWKSPKVVVTPHNSFVSDNISSRMFNLIYNNLRNFKENKTINNIVNNN